MTARSIFSIIRQGGLASLTTRKRQSQAVVFVCTEIACVCKTEGFQMLGSSVKHVTNFSLMSRKQVLAILDKAIEMQAKVLKEEKVHLFPYAAMPPGFISIMLQPSTGTNVSFDAAADYIGYRMPTAAIRDDKTTSRKKNERIQHLISRLYVQARIRTFAIRSPWEGLTTALALHFDENRPGHTMHGNNISFLNAGEGERYHPTQVLLDLLCIVTQELFGEAIWKDGEKFHIRPNFIAALDKFLAQPVQTRQELIASAIDGKTICFAGDMKSRVLFDWLSVGRKPQNGTRMFNVKFIFVAPSFAQVDPKHLHGLQFEMTEEFSWRIPAHYFYRLRWRKEDKPVQFHSEIQRLDDQYRVNLPFADRLVERTEKGDPANVLDALPIDKFNPSITPDVEYHPAVLCWLQAWCSMPLRMAVVAIAYEAWKTEDLAMQNRWTLPVAASSILTEIEHESWQEHRRRRETEGRKDAVNLGTGSNLDHIPEGMADAFKDILRSRGWIGNIITSDFQRPREGNGDNKDILWFPEVQLHEWDPEVLAIFNLLSSGQITYNSFNESENLFTKSKVVHGGIVTGSLPCPRQVNPDGQDPVCITGLQEEIPSTPLYELYEYSGQQFARCGYCNSVHTGDEMYRMYSSRM